MGMHFKLAESIKKGFKTERFAYFDDYMCDLVYKNRDVLGEDMNIFIKLDPYGDKLFTCNEIKLLLEGSKKIIKKDILDYLDSTNQFEDWDVERDEFIEFANSMIKICTFALDNNKKIVSQGD